MTIRRAVRSEVESIRPFAFSRRSRPSGPEPENLLRPKAVFDLTSTDTTGWPESRDLENLALQELGHPRGIRYQPDSLGALTARESLASLFFPHDPSRWVLTASSSEAYGLLFQLLCDPGDFVASPRPGYPLVEELARFQGVRCRTIPLRFTGDCWTLDLGWVEKSLKDGAKALVLIQPANPTGWVLSQEERARVLQLCGKYHVPLISDEVFEAWGSADFHSLAHQEEVLCFTLGGLSKLLGLPHLKLGWIRVSGPFSRAQEATERLAILNDAVLSASTPIQMALPGLLEQRHRYQERIHRRLVENRAAWEQFGLRMPPWVQFLPATSGWFAICQVTEEDRFGFDPLLLESLAAQAGVLVQSSALFDLPRPGFVVSLIVPPSVFIQGLSLIHNLLHSFEH
ncbi:MAG: pyridoxal phosphate-dependent aminotransferase [Fibrobacteria bacterium]|nr:pyridoxal phosphate-dependent aminotransferase [Fibrobacteria bacterium]